MERGRKGEGAKWRERININFATVKVINRVIIYFNEVLFLNCRDFFRRKNVVFRKFGKFLWKKIIWTKSPLNTFLDIAQATKHD